MKSFYFRLDTRIIDTFITSIRSVFPFISLLYRPIDRVDVRRHGFSRQYRRIFFFLFFLIISIFVTVPAANNNNARGTECTFKHANSYTMDSFTIKALSSFPREEIRGRRRERWNSIFQSVVFVNSDGEAASVRRVALFGHFRHFGIETDQLSLSLSLSLSPISPSSFHSYPFLPLHFLLITYYFQPLPPPFISFQLSPSRAYSYSSTSAILSLYFHNDLFKQKRANSVDAGTQRTRSNK